jgi:hypothetical protein
VVEERVVLSMLMAMLTTRVVLSMLMSRTIVSSSEVQAVVVVARRWVLCSISSSIMRISRIRKEVCERRLSLKPLPAGALESQPMVSRTDSHVECTNLRTYWYKVYCVLNGNFNVGVLLAIIIRTETE